jgi:hypothetical protein
LVSRNIHIPLKKCSEELDINDAVVSSVCALILRDIFVAFKPRSSEEAMLCGEEF